MVRTNGLIDIQDLATKALPLFGFLNAKDVPTGRTLLTLIASWENTIYRLDSDEGAFVLRLHPACTRSTNMVTSELDWLEFLSEKGLRVPRPRLSPDGQSAVYVSLGDPLNARICSILTWMPGVVRPASNQNMESAGMLLARLHRCGIPPFVSFNRPKLDFDWLVGSRGGLGYGPAPLNTLPTEYSLARNIAIPSIAEAFTIVQDQGVQLVPIHGDFHLGNLVFDDGTPMPIDFDDCGLGLPHYDIATFLHLHRESKDWSDLMNAFLRGYASAAHLPPQLFETLDRFMLARRLCMLLWMAAKARSDARMRSQLPKMLDNLNRLLVAIGVKSMRGSS